MMVMIKVMIMDTMYVCVLGANQLRVEWVSLGTQFRIKGYDGSESIVYSRDDYWSVA